MIETEKYIRKPLIVSAVRVTQANFEELASWCTGEILQDEATPQGPGRQYIHVRVHNPKNPWQTKAYVGDWLLYTERGYKIYKNKAFHASFEPLAGAAEKPGVSPEQISPREAKSYPYEDGDTTVLGPEIFVFNSATDPVISWRGENYVAQTPPSSEMHEIKGGEVVEVAAENGGPNDNLNNTEVMREQQRKREEAAGGRRILTTGEQKQMTADEVKELLASGEAVLEQDLAV